MVFEPLAHGEVLVHSLVFIKLEGAGGERVLLVVAGYADLLVLLQHAQLHGGVTIPHDLVRII